MVTNNSIPAGWERDHIGNYAKVKRGASPRPIQDPKWWGGETGWVRISDVTASRKYLKRTRDYLSPKGVRNSIEIEPGDVILSICATIGRPIITTVPVCIHDGFVWFDGLSNQVDREYFYYFLASQEKQIANKRQVGTQGNLNSGIVSDIELLIPSCKSEQSKIAEILSTVDRAIEQSEALIAKQQRIKTGLMQDLLTRGIDKDGSLRSEETHEFKDSPLGRIPVEWEVCEFEKLYASPVRDFGSFSSTTLIKFLDSGIPFIKSEMIEVGKIKWQGVMHISEKVHHILRKSHVHDGDILFSKIGSALGKAVVYDGSRGVCNSNAAVAKINVDRKKASNAFVTYVLNHDIARTQFRNVIVSLLPRINLGDINQLFFPVPPLDEQVESEKRLRGVDTAIASETRRLDKFQAIKTALMQDLLTGKKRVTPLLDSAGKA